MKSFHPPKKFEAGFDQVIIEEEGMTGICFEVSTKRGANASRDGCHCQLPIEKDDGHPSSVRKDALWWGEEPGRKP